MKKLSFALILSLIIIISGSSVLFAKSKKATGQSGGTDFDPDAEVVGVSDGNLKEYTYIDMGKAQGVKKGDRFMVQGKYGKVMVEVVEPFQRMAAVKIVDSWLLDSGNKGNMMASSRYPKVVVGKYTEKKLAVARPRAKKTVAKKEAAPVTANVPALPGAPDAGAAPEVPGVPGVEGMPGDELGVAGVPGMEAMPGAEPDMGLGAEPGVPGLDAGAEPGIPGMESDVAGVPSVEPGVGLPGEEAGAPGMPGDDLGLGAEPGLPGGDLGAEPGLPGGDLGAEPGLPGGDLGAEPGLPGGDLGAEPGLPGGDMGAEPGLPGGDLGAEPGLPGGDMGAEPALPGGEPALPGGDLGAEPGLPGGEPALPGDEPGLPGGDMSMGDPGMPMAGDALPPMP